MLFALLSRASGAHAQTLEPPADGLRLEEAIRLTLATDPEILLAVQQAEAARGVSLAAGAPFDLVVDSQAAAARSHTDPGVTPEAVLKDVTTSAGVERLFRNGASVSTGFALTRQGQDAVPGAATPNVASVALNLRVPLLKDRGGRVSASAERAAQSRYDAALQDLRHTMALRVLTAAVAYWDYSAASGNVAVLLASEQRALRTVEETRVLVRADERTSADLNQLEGNLASKRLSRTIAEQGLVEARQQLGLVMGIDAPAIASLPPASTGFPELPEEPGVPTPVDALVGDALARRADLAAAERALRAADFDLRAARSDLQPRLDLLLGSGYNALEPGLGFGSFVAPLYRRDPRLDVSVGVSYRFPFANSGARGRLVLQQALHEQQRIAEQELRRRIAVGLAAASSALTQSDLGSRAAEDAVRLLEAGVDAERRKFQLGVSTLFDLVQAQDALTSALLGRIGRRRDHAVAIASLRFQAGLLVSGQPAEPVVDVARLRTAP